MSTQRPQISVVIPSYNRKDSVLRLLKTVYEQQGVHFEVVVVDDCSPDDSLEAIAAQFPQVRLFTNEVNGGPSVTRNRGVRESRADIIVGFDSDVTLNDCYVLKKTLEEYEKNPSAAGFAFRIFAPDGKSDDVPRWWHPLPIELNVEKKFPTHYFSGTAYSFKRSIMIEAGLYPEILYMHYEEVELAYRILDTGADIFYSPDLTAVHHESKIAQRGQVQLFYKPRNQILHALSCMNYLRATKYVIPRTFFQGLKSIVGGHPHRFLSAIGSAIKLTPAQLKLRQPLSEKTWQRIAQMKTNH
ncbi:MAG: glycosyltransferase family 2 protein [Akkermansiaceae bacterium]